jgi:hypothetical protein
MGGVHRLLTNMKSTRRRRAGIGAAAAFVGVCVLALAAAAATYQNGRLPRSALSPIYIPGNTAFLGNRAARNWNTMRLCALASGHDLYPEASSWHPAATAYRTYQEQVALYNQYGYPHAAYPGTSNHGWGRAVDLATHAMRSWIDAHGEQFGWGKHGDAPDEWWHITFDGRGKLGPDPGISASYPLLRVGSGGHCQDRFVREVQTDLGIRRTGYFDTGTAHAVHVFQLLHHLHVGPVNAPTWRALRRRHGAAPASKAPVSKAGEGPPPRPRGE